MAGDVPLIVGVNGPDELLESVRAVVRRIERGEALGERVLYEGTSVPAGMLLDTYEFPDGTYELEVSVRSIYGTGAQASIRFRVANWRVIEDELLPPFESLFGLIDRSETVERSGGWRHVTGSPGDFFGDGDRLTRRENTTEHLVWEAPGLHEIAVTAFARDPNVLETIQISASAEMNEWELLPVVVESVRESDSGWLELQLLARVAEGTPVGYVRVTLREGESPHDVVQLGKVRLALRPAS